jgi:hypothetical protein
MPIYGHNWDQSYDHLLKEHYEKDGWEILSFTGLSRRTIQRQAAKLGLVTQQSKRRAAIKLSLKEDYFTHWSPAMAYDLGNGFADGCVFIETEGRHTQKSRYSLHVQRDDESIILGTRDRIGSHHTINRGSYKDKRTGSVSYYTRVAIYSRPLCDTLIFQHGMVPNKSHQNVLLPEIPESLFLHFARGHFDGDGSVSGDQHLVFYFMGTENFIRGLQIRFAEQVNLPVWKLSRDERKPHLYRAQWSALEDLKKIYGFLYPEGSYPFLERKKRKLLSFLQEKGYS